MTLMALWIISGCMQVKMYQPKVSEDGKSVTYECMQILKTVYAKNPLLSEEPFIFPPQNLKLMFTSSQWKLYKAEKIIPETPFITGLAVNKNDGTLIKLWDVNVALKIKHLTEDVKDVEYRIIEITEEM